MLDNSKKTIDPELQKDLSSIINGVEMFFEEQDSVLLSFLRQKNLPELFETCQN